MEGDQQLEAGAIHPTQKIIFCSTSLAQTYLTDVVDDIGQRDIFPVPDAMSHGLPCWQTLLSRLQILLSLCKSYKTLLSELFTRRSCYSPGPPLPFMLALSKIFVSIWPQTCPLFSTSSLFLAESCLCLLSARAYCLEIPLLL